MAFIIKILLDRDQLRSLFNFRRIFRNLKRENTVLECGMNILLRDLFPDIEAPVACSGVALLAYSVAFGVLLLLCLVL